MRKKLEEAEALRRMATLESPGDVSITRAAAEALARNSTARTRQGKWPERFLEALAVTANVTQACRHAGVTRDTAYTHKKANEAFAARWESALEEGVDLMEAEARRRGFDGVDAPRFQGGKLAGVVREYSDALAALLLKAHRPDIFSERIRVKDETPHRGSIDPAQAAAAIARLLGEIQPGTLGGGAGAGPADANAGGDPGAV